MCNGEVQVLRGRTVALTGKVSLGGERTLRPVVVAAIAAAGAQVKPDASGKVDIVVHGDLSSQHVVDDLRQHSQKLEFVAKARARGRHICVISSRGLSELLAGGAAPCLARYVVR